jgi:hypothetical protein
MGYFGVKDRGMHVRFCSRSTGKFAALREIDSFGVITCPIGEAIRAFLSALGFLGLINGAWQADSLNAFSNTVRLLSW